MGLSDSRRSGRRFRRPYPGEQVNLSLEAELPGELASCSAASRVQQLRASGVHRLPVRVLKAPHADVLAPEDAVKIQAPKLSDDAGDAEGIYVRVKFLDLPLA
jgi:hypothetical protein